MLLGVYNFAGGSCLTLGSLGPKADTPDLPFYTASQQRALEAYVDAASALDPVNAGIGALVGLVGLLLMVGSMVLFTQSPHRALVGQFAFGASIVLDGLQIVWLAVWYVILWGPTLEYVASSLSSLPDQPPGMEQSLPLITGVSVILTVLVGALYYAVKIGLAGFGFLRCRRADRSLEEAPVTPASPREEPGLEWALDEPAPSMDGTDDAD